MIDRMIVSQIIWIAINPNTYRTWSGLAAPQLNLAFSLHNTRRTSLCHVSRHTLLDISLFEGVDSGLLFNRERVHALCLYDSGERDPCAKHQGGRT